MLFSVEQAFLGRDDEKRAPLKIPVWEAMIATAVATVSVKMAGTLWGLLVPSMLVYKIW